MPCHPLRQLLIIPPALLVNFFGYAYADLVLPLRAARIPYLAFLLEHGPLVPSHLDCGVSALRLDLGTFPGSETLCQLILSTSLAISPALSDLTGLGMRGAARNPPQYPSPFTLRAASIFTCAQSCLPSRVPSVQLCLLARE